ncbi:MAG: ricin-type beta-trefoil lectin domain protein [Labilithrix sp.]
MKRSLASRPLLPCALLFSFLANGCLAHSIAPLEPDDETPVPEPGSTSIESVSSALYRDPGSPIRPNLLRYCFDNRDGNSLPSSAERALIRRALENTWNRYSRLAIIEQGGGHICPLGYSGLRIHLQNAVSPPQNYVYPITPAPGGYQYGAPWYLHNDLVLTTTYAQSVHSGGANAQCRNGPGQLNHCIYQTVVHEFGHAIGYYHEQQRPDTTCAIKQNTPGGVYNSAPDDESVMSVSGCGSANKSGDLSKTDIFSVQRDYNRKVGLVTFDGRCVDVPNAGSPIGQLAHTWDCLTGTEYSPSGPYANQNASYSNAKHFLLPTGKVLDIHANSASNGAPIQSWDFLGTAPSQNWTMENMQIQSMGAMCVDWPSTAVGTQLDLRDCSGSPKLTWNPGDPANVSAWANPPSLNTYKSRGIDDQMFTWQLDGHIKLTGPSFFAGNKCLGVRGGSTAPGMPVELQTCADVPAQKFAMFPNGQLRPFSGVGGICLDAGISDLKTFTGTPTTYRLQASPCVNDTNGLPRLNQQFNFYGQVKASWNRCMDVAGWGRGIDTQVWSWACDNILSSTPNTISTKQFFAYYW